jgi:dolichol-phosphate mannosyltransferase
MPAQAADSHELSVVVPAYDEAPNIAPLTRRLFAATRKAGLSVELLIADDESPGSAETARQVVALAAEGFAVRLQSRKRSEGRGLSSAVLLGFAASCGRVVLCMDADLQHEPEAVPAVAAPVLAGTADFAVGSRNMGGGGVGFEWSLLRRVISQGATLLAVPLSGSTDPMSGFFCLSRDTLARGAGTGINARGFKIGLELMVRCGCRRVVDVPITFRQRVAGESKLSMKQNVEYLIQLIELYRFRFGVLIFLLPVLAVAMAIVGAAYVARRLA